MRNNPIFSQIFYRTCFLFLISIFLMGCDSNQECSMAAEFGQQRVFSFSPKVSPPDMIAKNGDDGSKPGTDQSGPWIDTHLLTEGSPILMKFEGSWNPWGGTSSSDKTRVCGNFKNVNVTDTKGNVSSCPIIEADQLNNDTTENGKTIYGAPCWLENGMGVYILLFHEEPQYQKKRQEILADARKKRAIDKQFKFKEYVDSEVQKLDLSMHPNGSVSKIRNPTSPNIHVASVRKTEDGMLYFRSVIAPDGRTLSLGRDWRMFIKVLSNNYQKNSDAPINIQFLSGVKSDDPTKSMPFSWIYNFVKKIFMDTAHNMFVNMTQKPSMKILIGGIGSIFLISTGFGYITGMINASFGDMIFRILKIGFVFSLVHPESWVFFNENLFMFFIGGLEDFTDIISSAIQIEHVPSQPLYFLDDFVWRRLFSADVWDFKMRSLSSLAGGEGVLWCAMFGVIAVFFVYLAVHAFVIFCTAVMALSLLIALSPIAMLAILIPHVKYIFDGWVTSMINYTLQGIMIMALIVFIFELVQNHIYKTIGFTTCKRPVVGLSVCPPGVDVICENKDVISVVPGRSFNKKSYGAKDSHEQNKKAALEDHSLSDHFGFSDRKAVILVPPYFIEEKLRYIDLPFLDLDDDRERIDDIKNGNLVNLMEFFCILIITVLGVQMRDAVMGVAQVAAGGEAQFHSNLGVMYSAMSQVAGQGFDTVITAGGRFRNIKHVIQDAIGGTVGDRVHRVGSTIGTFGGILGKQGSVHHGVEKALKKEEAAHTGFINKMHMRKEFLKDYMSPKNIADRVLDESGNKKTMKDSYEEHMNAHSFIGKEGKVIREKMLHDARWKIVDELNKKIKEENRDDKPEVEDIEPDDTTRKSIRSLEASNPLDDDEKPNNGSVNSSIDLDDLEDDNELSRGNLQQSVTSDVMHDNSSTDNTRDLDSAVNKPVERKKKKKKGKKKDSIFDDDDDDSDE